MTAPALTMRQLVEGMSLGFDPAAADGPAVVEFAFTGAERGTYQLVVADGACRFRSGSAPSPTLRIEADADVWRAVAEGRLEAMAAVVAGKLSVNGDLGLFQRLPRLFRRVAPDELRASPGQRAPGPLRLPAMAWLAVAFVPWKLFWVVTGTVGPRAGIATAAAAAAVVWAAREATGGATFFERATAALSAAAGAAVLVGVRPPPMVVAASLLALAAIWAGTLVRAPLPLTAEYSRWNYALRVWGTGLFRHPNAFLTLVWAGTFAVLATLAAGVEHGVIPPHASAVVGTALGLAMGWYTKRHERGVRTRRVEDLDGSLARLEGAARAFLALAAAGFLALGPPGASGWAIAPAVACALLAVRGGRRSEGVLGQPVGHPL